MCISPTLTGTRTSHCVCTCSSTQQTLPSPSCRCQISSTKKKLGLFSVPCHKSPHGWVPSSLPPTGYEEELSSQGDPLPNLVPYFLHKICAGAGNQWQTSPHGHHFRMVSPPWSVSVWYNHSLTSVSCRAKLPVRSSTDDSNESFLTTACSTYFPSPYFSKLWVHLVPLVAKTENSLVLSPLFCW